jgi:hypothetical protein
MDVTKRGIKTDENDEQHSEQLFPILIADFELIWKIMMSIF